MGESSVFDGRILVVAFEGWNDAGEAASSTVRVLLDQLEVVPLATFEAENFYDFQQVRPTVGFDDEGRRVLSWPSTVFYSPLAPAAAPASLASDAQLAVTGANSSNVYLLLGAEPSRNWQTFAAEVIDLALASDISGIVFLGSLLAEVPHTRPIPIFISSENAAVRSQFDVERSTYEGPVGILSVLADAAEKAGIPTMSLWASVPHYVHHAPSPKATLAIIDRLEEIVDVTISRGTLVDDAETWVSNVDALADEDEDMAAYITGLERSRDAFDSPEASGEALAQEFERFLRDSDEDHKPEGS
ncbi:MAG: hypothetical protein RLZZ600_803 [Actinomycetota bacterium]|jgi:hypothetical protein